MGFHKKITLVGMLIVILVSAAPVAALEGEPDEVPACGEGIVSGTVVAVDEETGTVTIDTGDGKLCTVTLDGEYDHPIVALLGSYFGDVSAESLKQAIGDTIQWNVDEDGVLIQPGDEIAAYHDAGIGFGVLVKLYAITMESQEDCDETKGACGVTVEELVQAFLSGTGIGELFKEYGKPSTVGIGHVRKIMRSRTADDNQPYRVSKSRRVRPSGHTGRPENAGPKKTALHQEDKPGHAGPKPESPALTGNPDKAGPKPKAPNNGGKQDHAGPKPKPSDQGGKPDHAGPKPKSKGK